MSKELLSSTTPSPGKALTSSTTITTPKPPPSTSRNFAQTSNLVIKDNIFAGYQTLEEDGGKITRLTVDGKFGTPWN